MTGNTEVQRMKNENEENNTSKIELEEGFLHHIFRYQIEKEEKERKQQFEKTPQVYIGMSTKKWDKDFLPVCIVGLCFTLFIVLSLSITYETTFEKGNYLFKTNDEGRISCNDGCMLLFFMFVALVCCHLKLYGWALGVETIATLLAAIGLYGIASGEVKDGDLKYVLLMLSVIASEICIIWSLIMKYQRKKR